jgi:hypothetical protein
LNLFENTSAKENFMRNVKEAFEKNAEYTKIHDKMNEMDLIFEKIESLLVEEKNFWYSLNTREIIDFINRECIEINTFDVNFNVFLIINKFLKKYETEELIVTFCVKMINLGSN